MSRQAVPNVELGRDTARANLLTNGGFEVWQRGNGPFSANAGYSADRWVLSIGGGSSLSISRQAGNASAYAASFSYTHSGASQLIQKVEVGAPLGKTVTFAVDVFTASANAVRVLVWDALGGLNYSTYHTGNSTWQRLSSTLAVSASATQLQVYVEFAASSGGALDNAMLVVGSVAADYAPLHPADDLARCLRYMEYIGASAGNDIIVGGVATAGSQQAWTTLNYKVEKPVTPTVTVVGTWNVTNSSQPTNSGSSQRAMRINAVSVGAGQFNAYNGTVGNVISIEANP